MAANVKNLPLSVIFAAKSGDGQALGAVLNHYQRHTQFGDKNAYRRMWKQSLLC